MIALRAITAALLIVAVAVPAEGQSVSVRRPLMNRPLADVLRELQQRGLPIVFSSEVVRPSMRVTTEPGSLDDRQVLDDVLAPHRLEARAAARGVLLVVPVPTPAPVTRASSPPLPPPVAGARVSGVVVDSRTGAPLPSVVVRAAGAASDQITGADGRFDLGLLPSGAHRLFVSVVGYSLAEIELAVNDGTPLDVTVVLADGARTHSEEVVVVGDRFRGAATSTPSTLALTGTDMRELRGVLADDAFRAVQVAPGVSTANDYRSEFSIRGNDYRHVGLLVDGLSVGWPVHAVREDWSGGSVGLLNADTIDNLTLVSGVHPQDRPARTGGWVEMTMREGSRARTQAHAALGMTSASLITEGPIGRQGRGSWIVSARQSYLQWVIKRLNADGTSFGFGDVFAKLVYDVTPRHQVQMLAIAGRSLLELDFDHQDPNLTIRGATTTGMAGVSWRAIVGATTVTQRVGFTGVSFNNDGPTTADIAAGHGAEMTYRADAAAPAGAFGTVQGGVYLKRRSVDQRFTRFVGFVDGARPARLEVIDGRETELIGYARGAGRIGRIGIDGGLLLSSEAVRDLAPWVAVHLPAGPWSLRAGAGVYRQRPELEQSASSFADAPLRAETSRQVDLEVERAWSDRSRVVVTAYRRRDRDGLRLTGDAFQRDATGLHAPSLTPWWRNTLQTRASGIEVLAQRRSPTGVSGWIAYAYATSSVEDVTTGETWDADFDQRHTLNAHAQVRWSPVTSFSGKVRVGSNVPLLGYLVEDAGGLAIGAERNRVRLPLYARLDLRATRAFNFAARRLSLFVEILNVLGRENRTAACACTNWADAPRVQSDGRVNGATQRLFPFLPSVGFVFDF